MSDQYCPRCHVIYEHDPDEPDIHYCLMCEHDDGKIVELKEERDDDDE